MNPRRTLRFTWLLAGVAAVAALPLLAQPGYRGERHHGFAPDDDERGPGMLVERLAEVLDLTDAQLSAARTIHEETRATVEPLREDIEAQRDALEASFDATPRDLEAIGARAVALHDTMDAIRAAHDAAKEKFVALLTPEQKTKFEALQGWMDDRREDGPGFGRRGRFGPRDTH